MDAPERIHCNWNAADAADAFYDAGVELNGFLYKSATSEKIVEVLANIHGIFRLLGRVAITNEEVALKVLDVVKEHNLVRVESTLDPTFMDTYEVVGRPAPHVSLHGDILFDLAKATL